MGNTALLKKQKKWPRPQGSVKLWSWEETEHLLPLTLLSPIPALLPPFTLQELEVPLIDAQTCNAYYQENSVSSTEPVILEDMLCAGFVEGGKDACNVSEPYPDSGQGVPLPSH